VILSYFLYLPLDKSWVTFSNQLVEMAYQAFRENGAPTWYDANPTDWQADILESGLIFAFVILAVSFFVILPGIRGKEVRNYCISLTAHL
jgi:hypothetical protein